MSFLNLSALPRPDSIFRRFTHSQPVKSGVRARYWYVVIGDCHYDALVPARKPFLYSLDMTHQVLNADTSISHTHLPEDEQGLAGALWWILILQLCFGGFFGVRLLLTP